MWSVLLSLCHLNHIFSLVFFSFLPSCITFLVLFLLPALFHIINHACVGIKGPYKWATSGWRLSCFQAHEDIRRKEGSLSAATHTERAVIADSSSPGMLSIVSNVKSSILQMVILENSAATSQSASNSADKTLTAIWNDLLQTFLYRHLTPSFLFLWDFFFQRSSLLDVPQPWKTLYLRLLSPVGFGDL